jgi:hypothetical protein
MTSPKAALRSASHSSLILHAIQKPQPFSTVQRHAQVRGSASGPPRVGARRISLPVFIMLLAALIALKDLRVIRRARRAWRPQTAIPLIALRFKYARSGPRSRPAGSTRAIHAMRRAYDLVVLPALPIALLPRAVFIAQFTEPLGERLGPAVRENGSWSRSCPRRSYSADRGNRCRANQYLPYGSIGTSREVRRCKDLHVGTSLRPNAVWTILPHRGTEFEYFGNSQRTDELPLVEIQDPAQTVWAVQRRMR